MNAGDWERVNRLADSCVRATMESIGSSNGVTAGEESGKRPRVAIALSFGGFQLALRFEESGDATVALLSIGLSPRSSSSQKSIL
jgi:hypothetical protein